VGKTRAKPDARRRVLARRSYSGASLAGSDVAQVGPAPVPLTVGPRGPHLTPLTWVSADVAAPVSLTCGPHLINDLK
jgi:hypothetical protein